jgi:hypothetical protein
MTISKKLIQQMNDYYGTEYIKDESKPKEDKPEDGKVYALTGGPGSRCIANGNTWAESEVDQQELLVKSSLEKRK